MDGGERIARVLERHGVRHLFTLCGGHISPILVGAKGRGIRVVDVRDEASAVFAADAAARLTGIPGVAAVTAGPGVTNALTALQNARMAESPVVVFGGATATVLKGRGALQDIDQVALVAPAVKATFVATRVHDLPRLVEEAFATARGGVPGPVFVEVPVDLLYREELVRAWYGGRRGGGVAGWALRRYLGWHVDRLFRGAGAAAGELAELAPAPPPELPEPQPSDVRRAARRLAGARRPVLLVGAQAMTGTGSGAGSDLAAGELAAAVAALGVPTYLTSSSRGLLGPDSDLQVRHRRRQALREADLVILAGVPADFRLDYGRQIGRRAEIVAANLSPAEMRRNRKPDLAVEAHPGRFLAALAARFERRASVRERWHRWRDSLAERDRERDEEIAALAAEPVDGVNPIALCQEIDRVMGGDAVIVADGGDFVATAAYVVRPRGPLGWLDPGAFGTLGVGGGFAVGAALCRPASEVWLLWGDGAAGFSLAELDTCARHGLPVIAVVGNDGGWAQIEREQVEVLGDAVGTELARCEYHRVAEGYGAAGLVVARPEEVAPALARAQEIAAAGRPVLINVLVGRTAFRKGSISM
ncbi:MAG TPA: thiamine pyrophosphate-binding protein [Thermoanaerobaculia bacterium]|nr:thiamine pyrophosphate-binding protein [Thermoanaerobaculia bacterium]